MATRENAAKRKVKRLLDSIGVWYFSPQSGIYGRSGIPDIIGCYKGKFFAIECKAGGNTTTALQDKAIQEITDAGGLALVINEQNVDRLLATIIMLGMN